MLIAWVTAAAVLFGLALFCAAGGENGETDPVGPTATSRSAIGYAGLAGILDRLGTKVVRGATRARDKVGDGGLLIVAEPRLDPKSLIGAGNLLRAPNVLLILPKWDWEESQAHPGWIEAVALTPPIYAQLALGLVDKSATMARGPAPSGWKSNNIGSLPVLGSPTQFVRSKSLRPVIAAGDRILLGESQRDGRRIFVLADPDALNNQSLSDPANAAFADALISALRTGEGPVVFDESFSAVPGAGDNLLARLLKPPLLPGVILGIIAVGLLLWATIPRFGAPDVPAPALESGKRGLIDNIAALLDFGGRRPVIVRRYVDATVQDVARRLHAPRNLVGAPLLAWLARIGLARGVDVDCELEVAQAGALATGGADTASLIALVRAIHRWKQDIIHGTGRHQTNR